jgi:hypothetical protein
MRSSPWRSTTGCATTTPAFCSPSSSAASSANPGNAEDWNELYNIRQGKPEIGRMITELRGRANEPVGKEARSTCSMTGDDAESANAAFHHI